MKKALYLLLLLYALLLILGCVLFNGTGDSGDSVLHYLFARYAPQHPKLYFDHWAKPLFVLLASPFAQFGFIGIKVFNCGVSLITVVFTVKTAQSLQLKNTLLIPVFMLCAPLYYILTLSGLTEPLFAMLLSIGLFLSVNKRLANACLLLSFLPYVRSEGLIVLGVYACYLLLQKKIKVMPYLLGGSVLYAIAGFFIHHNFLWVFTKIPYANLGSMYGSGSATHFLVQLVNVVGVPLYALLWTGLLAGIVAIIKRKIALELSVLVYGSFAAFFIAHSLFWYLGIFNSMGLIRVFIAVIPLMTLIALQGFNSLAELLPENNAIKKPVLMLLTGYVLVFPLTPNPAAIHLKKDLMLGSDQVLANKVADYLNQQSNLVYPLLYSHHYLSEALHLDEFDESKKQDLKLYLVKALKPGQVIIWDNWFSGKESGIALQALDSEKSLKRLKVFADSSEGRSFVLFQKTDSLTPALHE